MLFYRQDTSFYLSDCKIPDFPARATKESLGLRHPPIRISRDSFLFVKDISLPGPQIELRAALAYENGAPVQIPYQYRPLFSKPESFERVKTYLHLISVDSFSLDLIISLHKKDTSEQAANWDCQQASSQLQTIRKHLLMIGISKYKNSLSLSLLKQVITLKKQIACSLASGFEGPLARLGLETEPQSLEVPIKLKSLVECPEKAQEHSDRIRKGGYFKVQKKTFDLKMQNQPTQRRVLAEKTCRNHKRAQAKMEKEIQLSGCIRNKKYSLGYYTCPNSKQKTLYMDYVEKNLQEALNEGSLTIRQKISISRQLVEAVHILHRSNVVHRDLKPENIMLTLGSPDSLIKVIDFGESSLATAPYDPSAKLGNTFPYSPPECMLEIQEGFNKPQIDLWSLLMVLYKLTFRSLPVSDSRVYAEQIVNGWRKEGNFYPSVLVGNRRGLAKIEEMVTVLTEVGLQPRQDRRLALGQIYGVVLAIEGFYDWVETEFLEK